MQKTVKPSSSSAQSAVVRGLVELIRRTSTELPSDVVRALSRARRQEDPGSSAAVVLGTILDNCRLARKRAVPLCQDTGTLTFFVDERLRRRVTVAAIKRATAIATDLGYLRKNCIGAVDGVSHDDNCAEHSPVVHVVGATDCAPAVTLLLKGGGSENMSRQYSLPDAELGAGRDLEGVRKCVLDAVWRAQGYGCAPGVLGVCIGGDRAGGYAAAKAELLRPLGRRHGDRELANLERRLLDEANSLGIGPMGLGGRTTLLDVHICARERVPASYFVTVAYMCWAARRQTAVFNGGEFEFGGAQ